MTEKKTNGNIVEIANLTTRFGAAVIQNNVSLTMRRGEILALVGGSGSGKSTLLRAILLLVRPASGTIRVFDREITGLADEEMLALRQRMGVMFQNGALFSSLTVLENVGLPLREHTTLPSRFIDEIAMMKISLAGLEAGAAAKFPSQLSGGMRKRAALARALALDPELILLDEPTSGLDPVGAGSLDEVILRLHEALHLSVLMVTHDLNSLWELADRIAMLGRGTIVALGNKEEVAGIDDPLIREFFHGQRGRLLTEQ